MFKQLLVLNKIKSNLDKWFVNIEIKLESTPAPSYVHPPGLLESQCTGPSKCPLSSNRSADTTIKLIHFDNFL